MNALEIYRKAVNLICCKFVVAQWAKNQELVPIVKVIERVYGFTKFSMKHFFMENNASCQTSYLVGHTLFKTFARIVQKLQKKLIVNKTILGHC